MSKNSKASQEEQKEEEGGNLAQVATAGVLGKTSPKKSGQQLKQNQEFVEKSK